MSFVGVILLILLTLSLLCLLNESLLLLHDVTATLPSPLETLWAGLWSLSCSCPNICACLHHGSELIHVVLVHIHVFPYGL